jgi:glycogen(starch) synthase
MPLRILQLGPYPPPEGGITRNMLAIRDELFARGHTCAIIATSQSSIIKNEPDVYRPRSAFGLLCLLWRLDYDILHLHLGGDISKRVLKLARSCSFFGKNKSILTLHSGEYPRTAEARNASPGSPVSKIFRRFSRLIAINHAIADIYEKHGVADDKIKIIPPFALKQPDKNVAVPFELTEFWKEHSPLIVSVGGLEKDYDPLFQIEAMKDIVAAYQNAGLVMIGSGSMRREAESAIASSGYARHIQLAGNVDHAVTLHLISNADVMLRATLFDGDAISVREALFLGTPVIATDVGERPEGVHLMRVGEKSDLINKICEIVSAPARHEPASQPHNANMKKVVDLYEELAGNC